jgi:hypothetical protein
MRDKARLGLSSLNDDREQLVSSQNAVEPDRQLQQTASRSNNSVVFGNCQKLDDDHSFLQQTTNSVRTESLSQTNSASRNSQLANASQHAASISPVKRSDIPATFNSDSNSFKPRMAFHNVGASSSSTVKYNEVQSGPGNVKHAPAVQGIRLQETDIDQAVQSSTQAPAGQFEKNKLTVFICNKYFCSRLVFRGPHGPCLTVS